MGSTKKLKQVLFPIGLMLMTVSIFGLFFQNCDGGSPKFSQNTPWPSISPPNGPTTDVVTQTPPLSSGGMGTPTTASNSGPALAGGQGYDGMTFIHSLASGTCADGSPVDTSIMFESGSAYLMKSNCINTPASNRVKVVVYASKTFPGWITYNDVELAPSGKYVWYKSTLITAGSGSVCLAAAGAVMIAPALGNPCDPFSSPGQLSFGPPATKNIWDMSGVSIVNNGDPSLACGRDGIIQVYSCR